VSDDGGFLLEYANIFNLYFINMRTLFDFTPTLGVTPIEEIWIDAHSRDDISQIALTLQLIWMNSSLRDQIVTLLQERVGEDTDQCLGRPGMNYWRIFVLGVFKYGLDCYFDRLTHMANRDGLVRELFQNDDSDFGNSSSYRLQTIIHNVSRITEEIWAHLNAMIVAHGFEGFGVAPDAPIEPIIFTTILFIREFAPTWNLLLQA